MEKTPSLIPKPVFDIKTILIIIFLAVSLFFGYQWYFKGNDGSKERVKELEKKFEELEEKKKVVDLEIADWKKQFVALKIKDELKAKQLIKFAQNTKAAEIKANKSKEELDKLLLRLAEIRKQIEEFKKHPSNREGDALLESIKNRTN
jgi:chromosome segregation ATPase